MKASIFAAAAALALSTVPAAALAQTFYGPTTYTSAADSPFQASDFSGYFHLEDAEDNAINTPGLSVAGACIAGFDCFVGTGLTDSVGNGGDGFTGRSIFTSGFTEAVFDAGVLGVLPTFAGLVWTDGNNPIVFEAFDSLGVSLGTVAGDHADGSFFGTLGDDRFYGVYFAGGISKIRISNPPGTEVDHIQYGAGLIDGGIPEPTTWAMMILGFGLAGAGLRRGLPQAA